MSNIDEELMGRQTLASAEEQQRAAGELRNDHAEERLQAATGGDQLPGDTYNQQQRAAVNAEPPAEAEEAPSDASSATGGLLKMAWLNLIDSFGLTLIYINIHIFGHSVLGEKIFCALGEEWIPAKLRTGVYAKSFRDKAKTLGLVEGMGLILLDLVALAALLVLVLLLMKAISLLNSWPVQTWMWIMGAWDNVTSFVGNIFK